MKSMAILLLALLVVSACSRQTGLSLIENRTFSDPERWIPEDFHPSTTVLLVETFPLSPRSNEEMKAFLARRYKGNYEVVDRTAIVNKAGKYADTKIYRYGLIWKKRSRNAQGATQAGMNVTELDGHFYDRLSGTEHLTTRRVNNYGMNSYIPFINTIVKHTSK